MLSNTATAKSPKGRWLVSNRKRMVDRSETRPIVAALKQITVSRSLLTYSHLQKAANIPLGEIDE